MPPTVTVTSPSGSIGIPLNEALQNLARRVESEELNLMVFSTIITRELGADISEIFDHLADVIRSRHRVMERVDTLTAQARLQAVVCGAIPRLAAHPGLHVCGNSYRGISVNTCIAEAPGIAETVLSRF